MTFFGGYFFLIGASDGDVEEIVFAFELVMVVADGPFVLVGRLGIGGEAGKSDGLIAVDGDDDRGDDLFAVRDFAFSRLHCLF